MNTLDDLLREAMDSNPPVELDLVRVIAPYSACGIRRQDVLSEVKRRRIKRGQQLQQAFEETVQAVFNRLRHEGVFYSKHVDREAFWIFDTESGPRWFTAKHPGYQSISNHKLPDKLSS